MSSPVPLVVSTTFLGPVAPLAVDSVAEAVVCVLGNTLPTSISSIQGNAPLQLHVNSSVPSASVGISPSSSSRLSAVSCAANVSFGASSGAFTLPAFVSTFSPVSAITDSNSARFRAPSPLRS